MLQVSMASPSYKPPIVMTLKAKTWWFLPHGPPLWVETRRELPQFTSAASIRRRLATYRAPGSWINRSKCKGSTMNSIDFQANMFEKGTCKHGCDPSRANSIINPQIKKKNKHSNPRYRPREPVPICSNHVWVCKFMAKMTLLVKLASLTWVSTYGWYLFWKWWYQVIQWFRNMGK